MQLERVVHAAVDAKLAYDAILTFFRARLRDALHADLRDDATARKSVSASRAFTLLTSSAKTAAVQPVTIDRKRDPPKFCTRCKK